MRERSASKAGNHLTGWRLPEAPDIAFNVAYLTGAEPELINQSLAGRLLSGDGPFTERAASLLEPLVGGGSCLLTTSCTHALEMAALLLRLGPGDEILMPTFTFPSMANAVTLRGATPVFLDARSDTLNIDETAIEPAISERTKAIFVMHYGGVACDLDVICEVASRHGIPVVEDNAHGLGGSWRHQPLGSFGALATQSFHATKNVHCGEGGALVLNDPELVDRAEIVREKGTNRSAFARGKVDKYCWMDLGSSYLPSDILAAMLVAQLEEFEEIQRRRHGIWAEYDARLDAWCGEWDFGRQAVPAEAAHSAHLFALLMPNAVARDAFIQHMRACGVAATFHYVPLHSSPFGRSHGRTPDEGCPVAEDVSARLVRLPLYPGLSDADLDRVIEAVLSFRSGHRDG